MSKDEAKNLLRDIGLSDKTRPFLNTKIYCQI